MGAKGDLLQGELSDDLSVDEKDVEQLLINLMNALLAEQLRPEKSA